MCSSVLFCSTSSSLVLEGSEAQTNETSEPAPAEPADELVVNLDVDINAPPNSEIEEEVVESAVEVIKGIINDSGMLNNLECGAEVHINIDIDLDGELEQLQDGKGLNFDVNIDYQGYQCDFFQLRSQIFVVYFEVTRPENGVDIPESWTNCWIWRR